MRSGAAVSQCSSFHLTAFTPRQVLLLNRVQQRSTTVCAAMTKDRSENKASSDAGDQKLDDDSVLTHAIALWLLNKGFTKVLKRFLSKVKIQDENWKDVALDLNDIYCKYKEANSAAHKGLEIQKKLDLSGDVVSHVPEEAEGKKKKNKKNKGASNGDSDIKGNNSQEGLVISENQVTEDGNLKNRKKSNSTVAITGSVTLPNEGVNGNKNELCKNGKQEDQHCNASGKQSTKKKDNGKSSSTKKSLDADEKKLDKESLDVQEPKKSFTPAAADGHIKSEKGSKKRKAKDLDGSESNGNETACEQVKPKKLKKSDKGHRDGPKTAENGHLNEESTPEEVLPSQDSVKDISTGHTDESKNDSLAHGMDKSNGSKSRKKKSGDSSEQKTVNAFKRVKDDDVNFVDERLQDNSYWAKDGAENGYGAKAQEVLGQVKGRDFRHEKTKKKRGSYRGGQIDLQSHSIKFNYPDEEE